MVSVVDTTGFHHQEEAFVVVIENVDCFRSHLCNGRLTGNIVGAVRFVLHVRFVEQTKQTGRGSGIYRIESGLIGNVNTIAVHFLPLSSQITAVSTVAFCFTYRVITVKRSIIRQEVTAAAAHGNINTVNVYTGVTAFQIIFKMYQLVGNVSTTGCDCRFRHIRYVFPVAVC